LIKILIPYALRAFTERNAEVEVEGGTAGDAINALANAYPALKTHLFTEDGQLRDFINLFAGGVNINSLQGLNTPVADNGEVMIVPAIAGGSDELTNEEIARYSRHLLLPEIGVEGQKKLKAA
jgi:adenylyltransferase/sulfurtransferase